MCHGLDISLFQFTTNLLQASDSVVGWGTLLWAGRSQVWVRMKSLHFFNLPVPSSHAWGLGFTQPLTDMSTRSRKIMFVGSRVWPVQKADNLTTICELNVYKMWEPQRLRTLWASMACYRDSLTNSVYCTFILLNSQTCILPLTHTQCTLLLAHPSCTACPCYGTADRRDEAHWVSGRCEKKVGVCSCWHVLPVFVQQWSCV
jgi:hypothetical protein